MRTKQSEKVTEKYLNDEVKKLDGLSIKLLSSLFNGLPDRLVLLPEAIIFFAELKSEGKNLSKIQQIVRAKIIKLGFSVYKIDKAEQVDKILTPFKQKEK